MAFSDGALTLTAHSANLDGRFEAGLELEDVVGAHAAHALRNLLAKSGQSVHCGILTGITMPWHPARLDATVHRHAGHVLVELEAAGGAENSLQGAMELVQSLARRLEPDMSSQRMAATAARIAAALLGYDQAVIYRFGDDDQVSVVAEALRPGLPSLLGAPDGGAPAVNRLAAQPMLAIADMGAATVPMVSVVPDGAVPDLAHAQLRCLLPEQAEAMLSQGIGSSLHVPLPGETGLWGALVCHHSGPRRLPTPERAGLELFGRILSLQLVEAERREARQREDKARRTLVAIGHELRQEAKQGETAPMHRHLPELAALLDCDGIAFGENGRWLAHGATPDMHGLEQVITLPDIQSDIWESASLQGLEQPLGRSDIGALMIVPLGMAPRRNVVMIRLNRGARPAGAERSGAIAWSRADRDIARRIGADLKSAFADIADLQRERRAVQERRRRIIRDELNHRIKNIITLIMSIARQTGAHAESVEDFAENLEGRLQALSRAHDQSISGRGSTSLARIIESEAVLYRPQRQPERLRVSGPEIALDERASSAVALVVHEMMTNAAKYGALSVPGGTLTIGWSIRDDGACAIEWRERDGPLVRQPDSRGFGTKLIATSMEYDLGGWAELNFVSEGLEASLLIPAAFVVAEVPRDAMPEETAVTETDLNGLSVLVVEDQALIAMELEDTLRSLGAEAVLAGNVRDALKAIGQTLPDVAILDFNLGGETSEEIAAALRDASVPFVFGTGYGDRLVIPERFQDAPVIGKPFTGREIAQAILSAVRRQPA